jgi:hypothetical protein
MDGFTAKDPLSNTPLNTPSFTFGSEAANLEYSILTAILGDPSRESNPTSDSHSSASPPPSVHHFSACPSEYSASWTSAPGNSLLPSEPNGFLPSPLVTVSDIQTIFEDSQLTLPFTDRSQTGSGSPSSSDFLSQTFTSIDPGSSATSSSAHIPQDSFTTPASSVMSPSQSALNPLALRWPLSSAESA